MSIDAALHFLKGCLVFHADAALQVQHLNSAWKQLARVDHTRLPGQPVLQLVQVEDRASLQQGLQDLLDERRDHYATEVRLANQAGALQVKLHACRKYDSTGMLAGILGILVDLGERRQPESRIRLADTLIEHISEAVIVMDCQQHILEVNPAFTRITGFRADQVIGRQIWQFHAGGYDCLFSQRLWRSLVKRGVWHGVIHERHRQGHSILTRQTISAVKDDGGEITHYVCLFSEITQ